MAIPLTEKMYFKLMYHGSYISPLPVHQIPWRTVMFTPYGFRMVLVFLVAIFISLSISCRTTLPCLSFAGCQPTILAKINWFCDCHQQWSITDSNLSKASRTYPQKGTLLLLECLFHSLRFKKKLFKKIYKKINKSHLVLDKQNI